MYLNTHSNQEYMHTASLGRRNGLISAQINHIKPEPLRKGLMWWRVLRSAHLAVPNDVVCIFSYEYPSEKAKSNWVVKRIGESARWADLIIRLVVKINIMSARSTDYNRLGKNQVIADLFVIIPVLYKSVNTACAKIETNNNLTRISKICDSNISLFIIMKLVYNCQH